MATKEDLILENELLKRKLLLAEAWMRREVAHHKNKLSENAIKKGGRKSLENILEQESVSIIEKKIVSFFGESLKLAPKFTLNHLIDAEIYWQTLQKFPTLDALPIVSSYQKVLEGFFENILVGFRIQAKAGAKRSGNGNNSLSIVRNGQNGLNADIESVVKKQYSLSLGRWFQFFQKLRNGNAFGGEYEDLLLEYLSLHYGKLLENCITDPFFSSFSKLIELEVFGKKRHDVKVSYNDAKQVRCICLNEEGKFSILKILLEYK